MNWITKILEAGKNIKQNIRSRVTKEDMATSDYVACCKGPIERKLLKENQFSHLKNGSQFRNQNT